MASFIIPRKTFSGIGSVENLKEVKGKKAVVVTGSGSMKATGQLDRIVGILRSSGISSSTFEGVEPDPSIETVLRGTKVFNAEQPDIIVGLGGCSAIDAAKAMWALYEHPGTTFEDIIAPFSIKPLRNKAHFVAIPSTSGTGTEVTCVAVITDRRKGVKYPLVSYELCPDVAIVDGELCKSMPAHVTANTGLDALAHDCEAYVSVLANSYTDPLAVESVRMIFDNLPKAVADGSDIAARQVMHDASCLAGMSFTNALLGIVHSMAHQLGGMFGVPHGRANAILMPNVMRYNSHATGKYRGLAQAIGKRSAEEFISAVEALRKLVGVENSLREYGIDENLWREKLDTISQNAFNDPCTGCNPRKTSTEDIKNIYQCCFEGKPVNF